MSDYYLVMNFAGEKWQMDQLEIRKGVKGDNVTVEVLNLTSEDLEKGPTADELDLFERVDGTAKIYIVDHASPNCPSIMHGHYSEVADYLGKRLVRKNLSDSNQKLRISLIACNAAVGNENSFAGLFHRYLGQVQHLNVDVLARNQLVFLNQNTMVKGIQTMPIMSYAVKRGLWEMGVLCIAQSDDVFSHQEPGTKVKFTWNTEGNEIMLDAYIDQFARMNREFAKSVFDALKDSTDGALIAKFQTPLSKLIKMCKEPETLDEKKMEKIIKTLNEIEAMISGSNLDKKEELNQKIQEISVFKNTSVNSSSLKPEKLGFNIHDQEKEMINPRSVVKRDFFNPAMIEFKKLPPSEERDALENELNDFLSDLGKVAGDRLKTKKAVEREKAIGTYIRALLQIANSKELSKTEKYNDLIILKNQIVKLIETEVVFSAELKGALEGIDQAVSLGGLTALKNMFPMASLGAENEKKIVDTLLLHIDTFAFLLLEYIETTGYEGFTPGTPDAAIQLEASNVAKVALGFLTQALSETHKIIIDSASGGEDRWDEKKIIQVLRRNTYLINETDSRLKKLIYSIENSSEQRVKDIYYEKCISPVINELESLISANEMLEGRINKKPRNKVRTIKDSS